VTIRKSDGFALIDLIFVVGLICVLCGIAMPKLLQARSSAGAASAIGSLRAISSSQLTFALTCGGGFYAPTLTTLGTAPPGSNDAFIGPQLGGEDTVTRAGYVIQMEATAFAGAPDSCNGLGAGESGQAFKAGADPVDPENFRFFAVNANAQIFEDSVTLYAAMPEIGDPPSGHLLK
jgi:type II secretory pathway pseudopilin PulG